MGSDISEQHSGDPFEVFGTEIVDLDAAPTIVGKFPGLGSIPVIGALFRSQEFQKDETELLIMVTPHLAKPLVPAEVQLPTDYVEEPSHFGWYMQSKR